MLGIGSQNDCLYKITMLYSNKLEEIPMKKKVIAILGIVIVISVCGGIYLHNSRGNEKNETIEQETESTQEETLPTEETETIETTETVELETETVFQEETTETQETEETISEETVESTERTSTPAGQKSTESPTTAPTASATETQENTVPESKQTANDGIDHGPEGDKPGYIYVPGYGYIVDEGGGVIEGSPEGAENGNKIGVMN